MSRSLKKGPFVSVRLLEQVQALNKSNQKKVVKTWSRARPSRRTSSDTRSPSTTGTSSSRCMCTRAWSGTSWGSSPRRGCSAATPASRKKKPRLPLNRHSEEEDRMEARAINRYIGILAAQDAAGDRSHPGKSANEALHILHFSPKHASKVAEKVLRSAISNLQNKDEAGRLEPDDILVKEAFVDAGMVMKRISPAPMGRAFRIRKRSNHVTIVVAAQGHGHSRRKRRPKPRGGGRSEEREGRRRRRSRQARGEEDTQSAATPT